MILLRQLHAEIDMLPDDGGALLRRHVVMRILKTGGVFRKVSGGVEFADVVVEGHCLRQTGIHADGNGCVGGQISNRQRVLVGSRCLGTQAAQQR